MARVLVVGLGSFDGGAGAARYCALRGDEVRVTDQKTATQLADSVAKLADLPIELVLGGHRDSDLDWAELVVKSPGVPDTADYVVKARAKGLPFSSEMNLFLEACPARILGITGSNGKSTTTMLAARILDHAGFRCFLGGNIGRSLLGELGGMTDRDWVVLELSSFHLEDAAALERSPDVAVLTNLTPNHLDRHGTFEAYRRAKREIFEHQGTLDTAVLNRDDPESVAMASGLLGRIEWFSLDARTDARYVLDGGWLVERDASGQPTPLLEAARLPLPGRHNLANALAAAAAARAAGADLRATTKALGSARALPHRLETVGTHAGRRFVNDSIATTPESTIAALASFTEPIHLLLGGKDKGSPLEELAAEVKRKASSVVLTGDFGARIAPLLADAPCPVERAANFADAFARLCRLADRGIILMSPATASYDEFRNFEARGDRFRELAAAAMRGSHDVV